MAARTYKEMHVPAQQTRGQSLLCELYQAAWRRQIVLCGPVKYQPLERANQKVSPMKVRWWLLIELVYYQGLQQQAFSASDKVYL